jgi:hypothetical protein
MVYTTTLYVLPVTNTLPTTGTTANLTSGQFGVFSPTYVPVTTGTITAQPYIIMAQGRNETLPGTGTKKSDKIYLSNVKTWFKTIASSTALPQIVTFSNFNNTVCGEDVTVSLRLKSFYVDTGFFNGKTESYTLTTPCCNCGSDPCATLTDTQIVSLIADFIDKINNTNVNGNNPDILTQNGANDVSYWVTASAGGTSGARTLIVTGNTLPAEPTSADPTVFSFQYDRLYFWGYAYKGPATSQDYNVWDACDPFATVTTTQTSTFAHGSSLEATQLEKNFWSNNMPPIAKRIWSNVNFNQTYITQVISGTWYDMYYLTFRRSADVDGNNALPQEEAVIILNPTGQNATTITLLTTFLGLPVDES